MRAALACLVAFGAGVAYSGQITASGQLYSADFAVAVEQGYGSVADGVQFYSLQRIDSKDIDRAVLSIDANLPMSRALAGSRRVRITIEAVEPRGEPQRLVR